MRRRASFAPHAAAWGPNPSGSGTPRSIQIVSGQIAGEAGGFLTDSVLVIEPERIGAERVEAEIDRHVSRHMLAARRSAAAAEGKEHLIRASTCPTCAAEIDLTDFDSGSYVFCPFCSSVFLGHNSQTLGREYRGCDECGYFGRVQEYPEFYFYFLLIVYGFRYNKRYLCTSCANGLFWKALLLNSIFVIGVPTAVWVKIKSVLGRDPGMADLRRATELAKKGRVRDAAPLFQTVLQHHPDHPGVLLNEGLGWFIAGDEASGSQRFSQALRSCPNYVPLMRLIAAGRSRETASR